MKFKVLKIESDKWKELSEKAHLIAFNEKKPSDWDRIDFALLAVSDEDIPLAYMTCREFSHDTIYWQYGGAFPPVKDTIHSFKIYSAFKDWHSSKYKRAVTYIENTNSVMLKMAMKIGFKITGIRNYNNEILLEHLLEFGVEFGNS